MELISTIAALVVALNVLIVVFFLGRSRCPEVVPAPIRSDDRRAA